jgi:tetratricopeptide (TPR) repeat protein
MPFADRIETVEEFLDDFEIHHHPDTTKSRGQYADLLKVGLDEEPWNLRYRLYYARELGYQKQYKEAAKHFKIYLKSKESKHAGEVSLAYRQLAECEPKNAEKYLTLSHEADPDRREPLINLAVMYLNQENWEKCFEYATRALAITRKRLDYITGEYAWGYLPYNLLAVARNNMTNEEKWTLNPKSLIATDFDLYGEAPKEDKPEQVLFDVK